MFCGQVKAYLSQTGVPYAQMDVTQNESYLQELEDLEVMTAPVLKIGDEVIVGFDRARIDQALAGN